MKTLEQKYETMENNLNLISKIYESFEALEETLGMLKLEEPLFITYVAKKSFANAVFNPENKQSADQKDDTRVQ